MSRSAVARYAAPMKMPIVRPTSLFRFVILALITAAPLACHNVQSPKGAHEASETQAAANRGNTHFHEVYDAFLASFKQPLGAQRPFINAGGGKLTLRFQGAETTLTTTTANYTTMKALAHLTVAALTSELAIAELPQPVDPNDEAFVVVQEIRDTTIRLEKGLHASGLSPRMVAIERNMLASVRAFLNETLDQKHADRPSIRRQAEAVRQAIIDNLREAAREHVNQLDAAMRELRGKIPAVAWPNTVVAITTSRQARAKSLDVLYFERLFHEQVGVGALGENRIIVLEFPVAGGAEHAMAAHLFDQELGGLLFGDRDFLQSDLVGRYAQPFIDKLAPLE